MTKAWSVALGLLGSLGMAGGAAGELPLPRRAQEIVQALSFRDGRTTFQGEHYEFEHGQLFKIIGRQRVRVRDPELIELPPAFVPRVGARMHCNTQTGQLLPASHALLHEFGKAFTELSTAVFELRVAPEQAGGEEASPQLAACVQAVMQWLIVQQRIAAVRLQMPTPAAAPPGAASVVPASGPREVLVEFLRRK
jgi:hypothetical protein